MGKSLKDILIHGGLAAATAGAAVLGSAGMEKSVLAHGARPPRGGFSCTYKRYNEVTDCSGDASWTVVYRVSEDESTARCYAHDLPPGNIYSMKVACGKLKPVRR